MSIELEITKNGAQNIQCFQTSPFRVLPELAGEGASPRPTRGRPSKTPQQALHTAVAAYISRKILPE